MTQTKKSLVASKFTVDVSGPVKDGIFDLPLFEKFLHDRVKVGGRTGNLGEAVVITKTASVLTITVAPNVQFAKRYIKYLSKKFLKKHLLKDYIRVVASSKGGYELRYFNIEENEEEEEEE